MAISKKLKKQNAFRFDLWDTEMPARQSGQWGWVTSMKKQNAFRFDLCDTEMPARQSGQWGWVTPMLKRHIWTLVLFFVCCLTLGSYLTSLKINFFTPKWGAVSPTSWVYCEGDDRYPVNVLSLSFHKSLMYLPWTQMHWKEGWTENFICSRFPSSLFTPTAQLFFPMAFAQLFFFNFPRHSQTQHLLQAWLKCHQANQVYPVWNCNPHPDPPHHTPLITIISFCFHTTYHILTYFSFLSYPLSLFLLTLYCQNTISYTHVSAVWAEVFVFCSLMDPKSWGVQ